MTIDRVTVTHIRIPLVEPFRISNGEVRLKDAIIVQVQSGGRVGIGEASPMAGSFYSEDTPESVWDLLTSTLVPAILSQQPAGVDEVNDTLDGIPGSAFAKAGIETAFWDLRAQDQKEPLYRSLGGSRTEVESGLAVGIYPTIGELIAAVETYLDEGYKRLKIKIQPGWDLKPLEAVRHRFGDIPLMVDANGAYGWKDIDHLKTLDEFDLQMIEQPLPGPDLEGHAMLQKQIRTSVCLDEGAENLEAVKKAVDQKACRIINIKIQRVGGLKKAKEIHDFCMSKDIPVWAGTMPELGIGGVQTLHLATLPNFRYPTDVESSLRWFRDDIVDPLIEARDGMLKIVPGIGNCFRMNRLKLEQYQITEAAFRR